MREAQVPSYRVRQSSGESGPPRLFLVAGGIAGLLAVGGLVGWAVTRYTDTTIPVIEADSRPIKVKPEDRGGLRVPNQDEIIFERRNMGSPYEPSGRLGPAAETPNLDALRAATTPPGTTPPPGTAPVAPPPQPAIEAAPAPPPAAPLEAAPPSGPAPVVQAPAPAAPMPAPAPAAPVRTAVAPPPAPVRAVGGVVVQLGALDSEEGARTEWERLGRRAPDLMQGRTPHIIRFEREGKPTMWRLRTGGFDSREAANTFCESMKSRGGACAVIGG
ncbi:SPOR domain-containing protein [Roseomonas sp. E05]|uniref:SPOR domain-containing protein n=1 Tax=Roseomonas sp. E05 TaxID=3046310 RepID=UPI0024BB9453|nr:SPOR domain-containing protein [Roseomonas sp. E05]MDJ0389803.1 SPOR domain-containing protein [Roseomonas sp. E05]